jgi:hypothetical protein
MSDPQKRIEATLKYLSGAEAGDAEVARHAKQIVGSKEYRDQFLAGYIDTALWTSGASSDSRWGEFMKRGIRDMIGDIAAKTKATMRKECNDFIRKAKKELVQAFVQNMDAARAGHNFWMMRSHSGSGFCDRGRCDVGHELNDIARSYGECSLYVEDGKVYQY